MISQSLDSLLAWGGVFDEGEASAFFLSFFLFFSFSSDGGFPRMKRGGNDDAGDDEAERKREVASYFLVEACRDGNVEAAKMVLTSMCSTWAFLSCTLLTPGMGTAWTLCAC